MIGAAGMAGNRETECRSQGIADRRLREIFRGYSGHASPVSAARRPARGYMFS
jgi:hypothetical protein